VIPVKFHGELSISFLRKKHLFTKKGGRAKVHIFYFCKPRHLKNGQTVPLEKISLVGSYFSCERYGQPTFNFDIDSWVLCIYRLIPRKFDFLGWLAAFSTTPVSGFWGASRSIHGRIQLKIACFCVPVDRYAMHRVACKIWPWVVHISSEK
jgi:hypothetical protein